MFLLTIKFALTIDLAIKSRHKAIISKPPHKGNKKTDLEINPAVSI